MQWQALSYRRSPSAVVWNRRINGNGTDRNYYVELGMVIGQPVGRLEDLALVMGAGRFVADMSLPFQLHMRLVRSPMAHGRLVKIDAVEALSVPGVVAVWTNNDIADLPPVDFRDPSAEALLPYRQPVLAPLDGGPILPCASRTTTPGSR